MVNKILSKSVVGVDIFEGVLRAILLQKKAGVISLQKAVQITGNEKEADVLENLKTLKNKLGVKKVKVVFSVPESHVSSHQIVLEDISASSDILKLEEAVFEALEEQFHRSAGECYMDFKLLSSQESDECRCEVKCISKEKLEPYLQAFKAIQWKPLIVDIDTPCVDDAKQPVIKTTEKSEIEGELGEYDNAVRLAFRGLEALC